MAYQVLARKWRPSRFSELVGQDHVVSAISNALDNNRLHHAYLFTGTRGVGKTTIARIFSKSLNCDTGMSANPCGECHTCKEIENGSFVDLLEIDAASRTKVEDTRELLDNVQYKPTRGDYKVYLIDEVHMLSKHSFNALLKTLEEPPPHVKFLLATTDPQKLPVTILSRCLQFNLKALSRDQISQQLTHVLSQEQIEFEPQAIQQLSRAAQGSMRDALSLTDQAIAQGNGNVSAQVVTDMLGLMDKGQVLKLVHSVFNNDAQQVMDLVEHLASQAIDFENVLAEMMSLLHQVALTQFVPEACKLETVSARAVFQLSKMLPAEQVQLAYQIALQGKKDLPFAADARVGLEMTLLRMLAFNPAPLNLSIDQTNEKVEEHVKPVAAEPSTEAQSIEKQAIEDQAVVQQNTPNKVEAPVRDSIVEPTLQQVEQLNAQQNDILQQAKALGAHDQNLTPPVVQDDSSFGAVEPIDEQFHAVSQDIDENSNMADFHHGQDAVIDSAPIHQPETDSAVQESDSQITSTQSLIALKNQLAQKEIASEVADTPVKKPDLEFTPSRFKSAANTNPQPEDLQENATNKPVLPANVADSSATTRPTVVLTENSEQTSTGGSFDSPNPSSVQASISPSHSAIDTKNRANVEEQSSDDNMAVSSDEQGTTPLTSVDSKFSASQPPWENEASNVEQSQNNQPLVFENDSSEEFDPMAHLNEPVEVEVDFDVPAFLQNGEKVVTAQQLDTWSQLIEQMQVTALTKQLALHSAYEKNASLVTLKLLDSKPHLDTESARNQLQNALSQLFNETIELKVEHTQPINTPFAVQQTINQVRMRHAQSVADNDENINRLKSTFAAQVVNDSIKPR